MLRSLTVQNYALIHHLDIEFYSGLNTLTGETGAGKSIILGALSLLLGNRADTSVLKDKSKKCVVEASFLLDEKKIRNFFQLNDLDFEKETIIRREIGDNGKTRAFINDSPVNLSILKELGNQLVDIHSQHEKLLLGDDQFQLSVIDSYAQVKDLLDTYQSQYYIYKNIESELNQLVKDSEQTKSDLDYFQFQFSQLSEAQLDGCNQEQLESELEVLNHTEEIKLQLSKSNHLLNHEEESILNSLKDALSALESVSEYSNELRILTERFKSCFIELNDLNQEIENTNNSVEYDGARIEELRTKLDEIYGLQQKFKVGSVEELIVVREELDKKLSNIVDYDLNIEKLTNQLQEEESKLDALASELSSKRRQNAPVMAQEICVILNELGIPNAELDVDFSDSNEYLTTGIDNIQFKFSANKNVSTQELSKIASGGELSRVLLSLKSILAKTTSLPTIIFDEIDSGTSGEIADKMGSIIKKMSLNLQVVNITHLPQIASKGDYHFLVYKDDRQDSTYTNIKLLNHEERIKEIAKMLSGEELTEAAVENAKNLLSTN